MLKCSMYTYYSSFAFLAVSLLTPGSWMQPYLSVLSATSILHHAKFYQNYLGRRWVQLADRAVAHVVGFRALYEVSQVDITQNNRYLIAFCYMCFAYSAMIYHGRLRHMDDWNLHKTLHVVSSLGLYALYRCTEHDKIEALCKPKCVELLLGSDPTLIAKAHM